MSSTGRMALLGKLSKFRRNIFELLSERGMELRLILSARLVNLISSTQSNGYLIGPTNSANQATLWARALAGGEENHGLASSLRISADPSKEWFNADHVWNISYRKQLDSRMQLLKDVFSPKRFILIESLSPLFAFRKQSKGFLPKFALDDIALLRRMGKRVGVVFHGSDIRDPQAHATRIPFSPFKREESADVDSIETLIVKSGQTRSLLPLLRREKIPLFITTPDLFIEVPDAIWLPVVIDLPLFSEIAERSPIFSTPKVRVLYLPSNSWIKSSALIVPVLKKLAMEGVIEFKDWVENGSVTHDRVPELLEESDIVIDQFIGATGVFAVEAAAAGRILFTYIDEFHAGNPVVPHVQVTPGTLETELRRIARDREKAVMRAQVVESHSGVPVLVMQDVPVSVGIAAAKDFVKFYHDGSFSVKVLHETLG